MSENNIYKKLSFIQEKLKAPKNQYNAFGKYKYRSCEDILEGLKPYLTDLGLVLNISDDVLLLGDRFYIKATAKLIDIETSNFIESYAYAREADSKKGMDSSQVTGATSSYARKYALNGLLAIDDTKDNDFYDNTKNNQNNSNNLNNQKQKSYREKSTVKKEEKSVGDDKTYLIENMFDVAKKANFNLKNVQDEMRSRYGKASTADLTVDEIKELIEWISQESFV